MVLSEAVLGDWLAEKVETKVWVYYLPRSSYKFWERCVLASNCNHVMSFEEVQ